MSMENGISSGFGVSDKAAALESDVGLDLKLQRTESFPYKTMMMMIHHHRPFSTSETVSGGGDGPTCNSGASEVGWSMCNIYDVAGAGAGAGSGSGSAADSGGAGVRTLQPFDISNTITTATTTNTAFKSPARGMAATLGFPFTTAQWKELERQAMIYKYMMASVPVPPDLLIPITRNLSDPSASHSPLGRGTNSIFNMRFSNNTDPEPGRCRRTDGKKWRCSRDVAPNQKYCERHLHRGRPRSRKPVEVHADLNTKKKTRHNHPALPTTPTTLSNPTLNTDGSSSHFLGSATQSYHQISPFLDKSNDKASPFESVISASSYKEPSRGFDWMMEGETVPLGTSNQQWQHLMQTKIGLTTEGSFCDSNTTAFHQPYEDEPLNLNAYTDFSESEVHQRHDDCTLFLNPNVVSLEKTHSETPRGFIDAWSNAVTDDNANRPNTSNNKSSVSSNEKLLLSSLTLSMAGGNTMDDEMGRIQMGLGVIDSDRNNGGGGNKSQLSSWLNPVSWVASTPGGPLAEVLGSSTVAIGSNPASPRGGNGDSGSPPATTVSSPSGVLQKTLASLSDSSVSSSPTVAASTGKAEIAVQWLSRGKFGSSS